MSFEAIARAVAEAVEAIRKDRLSQSDRNANLAFAMVTVAERMNLPISEVEYAVSFVS
ncbi:MAG: hypothetical protein ACRD34_11680 [Bryobacteraceae bacterium]